MEKKIKTRKEEIVSVSYAKINLILNVVSKLDNGYNELKTIFTTIDLKDNVKYSLTKSNDIEVLSNISELCGQANLVHTVATYLKNRYCVKNSAKIYIEKNIPLSAGLGGGSSNAANAIIELDKLWNLNLSFEEMNSIASKFGSDINFFLSGHSAVGLHRGEIIEPIEPLHIDNILLVKPTLGISSKEAYDLIKERKLNTDFDVFIKTLDYSLLFNDLQVGISNKYKIIKEIVEGINSFGAIKAQMSGSGSTCFGIFENKETLVRAFNYFKEQGYWVKITKTI